MHRVAMLVYSHWNMAGLHMLHWSSGWVNLWMLLHHLRLTMGYSSRCWTLHHDLSRNSSLS